MIEKKILANGFKYIEVRNKKAEAKIALQGAHIFHFQARGRPSLLWLSTLSAFEKGTAIRGGVPICFPWFGKAKKTASLPQHGFARTAMWELLKQHEPDENTTELTLVLCSSATTKKLWDYDFELRLKIVITSELQISLCVHNKDIRTFEISTALHSYFNVSNIHNVHLNGLDGCAYYDDLLQKESKQVSNLTIDKEVDRYYWGIYEPVSLVDENFTIALEQKGTNTMVVWNPWTEKKMQDMSNDAYRQMLCLETAQRGSDAAIVAPDESCTISVSISMLIH